MNKEKNKYYFLIGYKNWSRFRRVDIIITQLNTEIYEKESI